MKKILMIGTGGTIASELTDSGLAPKLDTAQLLRYIPFVRSVCDVDCAELMHVDSTNMVPGDWQKIAACIREHYEKYDGFVISHGTDTMAYTAAALSYLIQESPKPIVLTGAQRPIHSDTTDSKTNLTDAFLYACEERSCGVSIVFDGKAILGTRAKKIRTKSYSAFASINFPELAVISEGRVLRYIDLGYRGTPVFSSALCDSVGLVKLIPGADAGMLSYALDRYRAVIIESFGMGGLPTLDNARYHDILQDGVQRGKLIVMTTQVQNEGSHLDVYQVGRVLKSRPNVIEAFDMTTEAVVGKLMWLLGQTEDVEEIAERFYQPIARDILYTEQ